jgi:hypothetical protein
MFKKQIITKEKYCCNTSNTGKNKCYWGIIVIFVTNNKTNLMGKY